MFIHRLVMFWGYRRKIPSFYDQVGRFHNLRSVTKETLFIFKYWGNILSITPVLRSLHNQKKINIEDKSTILERAQIFVGFELTLLRETLLRFKFMGHKKLFSFYITTLLRSEIILKMLYFIESCCWFLTKRL